VPYGFFIYFMNNNMMLFETINHNMQQMAAWSGRLCCRVQPEKGKRREKGGANGADGGVPAGNPAPRKGFMLSLPKKGGGDQAGAGLISYCNIVTFRNNSLLRNGDQGGGAGCGPSMPAFRGCLE
jgi:hypothetical protein